MPAQDRATTRVAPTYADVPGFCKSATLNEIRERGHVLTPGRYVGAEAQEDDGEPFAEKMMRLVARLRAQQAEAAKLDAAIWRNLKEPGYDAWAASQGKARRDSAPCRQVRCA